MECLPLTLCIFQEGCHQGLGQATAVMPCYTYALSPLSKHGLLSGGPLQHRQQHRVMQECGQPCRLAKCWPPLSMALIHDEAGAQSVAEERGRGVNIRPCKGQDPVNGCSGPSTRSVCVCRIGPVACPRIKTGLDA